MTMIDANERLMKRINWTAAIYFGDSDKILLGKVNLSKFHIKDSKSAFQQMERDLKNLTELFSINLWIHPPYLHNRITQNISIHHRKLPRHHKFDHNHIHGLDLDLDEEISHEVCIEMPGQLKHI